MQMTRDTEEMLEQWGLWVVQGSGVAGCAVPTEQEARQDVINQNGNDGLHYRCHECAAEHCNCVSR